MATLPSDWSDYSAEALSWSPPSTGMAPSDWSIYSPEVQALPSALDAGPSDWSAYSAEVQAWKDPTWAPSDWSAYSAEVSLTRVRWWFDTGTSWEDITDKVGVDAGTMWLMLNP